ncbi:MAG: CBS domain-containing protein [Solirubrobacteraceae bacterium]
MLSFSSHALDRVRIQDCMRHPILSCDPETPIIDVAALMSNRYVHALVVRGDDRKPSAIVTDIDVMACIACEGDGFAARDVATGEPLTVASAKSLRDPAQLMAEHGTTHLVVVDQASGQPVGILSTTDIMAAYATAHPVPSAP